MSELESETAMRALVIAPQPFFSPRGTPFSVYHRTRVIAEQGIDVDFLTYGEGQDVEIPRVRIIRIPRFAFLGNVKVGPSKLKFFLDLFLLLWTIGLLIRRRYDFVHAHEEAVFFCLFLKPLFPFSLIYDMHSSLPEQLINFKFTRSKFLLGLFRRLEEASLRNSDAVITICPDLAEYAERMLNDKRKHFLIENSIFDTVSLAQSRDAAGASTDSEPQHAALPGGRRIVVYAGTLEAYQGIDLLIRAFDKVLEAVPEAYLLIVGGDPAQVDHYGAQARSSNYGDSFLFTGHVSQERAQWYCRQSAVQVSPRKSGTNTPLKIYEQLASGIPLVATSIPSHTQVLVESVAFLVAPDPDALAEGIVAALTQGETRAARVASAKRLYAEKYSREIYVSKVQNLLARIS